MLSRYLMFSTIGYWLVFIGIFLTITTMIGFSRFDNIYTRIHVSTINDMLGIPMAILGTAFLFLDVGDKFTFVKLIFATVIWYIVAPVTNYIIIKITYFYNEVEQMDENNSVNDQQLLQK